MGRNCGMPIRVRRQYGSGEGEVARILSRAPGHSILWAGAVGWGWQREGEYGISIRELKNWTKRTGSLLHDLVLYAFRFQNCAIRWEPFDINKEVSDTHPQALPGRDRVSLSVDVLILSWTENATYLLPYVYPCFIHGEAQTPYM